MVYGELLLRYATPAGRWVLTTRIRTLIDNQLAALNQEAAEAHPLRQPAEQALDAPSRAWRQEDVQKPPSSGGRRLPAIPPSYIRGEQATGGTKVPVRAPVTAPITSTPFGLRRPVSKKEQESRARIDEIIGHKTNPERNLREYGFIGAHVIQSMQETYADMRTVARSAQLNQQRIEPLSDRTKISKKYLKAQRATAPTPYTELAGLLGGGETITAAAKDANMIAQNFLPSLVEVGKAAGTDVYRSFV